LFTTTELQILSCLADGQTLIEIGEEVSLSHATVSKMLRAMERKSQLRLFGRSGRRLRLTSNGQEIATSARAVVEELRAVSSTVDALREGAAGTVRILMGSTPSIALMPRLIVGLMELETRAVPVVRIERGDVWARFAAEGFDVAVARDKPQLPSSFKKRWLFDDDLVLFTKATPEGAPPLTRSQLLRSPIIGPLSSPLHGQAVAALREVGFRGHLMEVESYSAVDHLVQMGAGVGLLSRLSILQEMQMGRVEVVGGLKLPGRMPYWLAVGQTARNDALIQRVETLLLAEVASVFGSDTSSAGAAETN
jgi:DNA-binding transcriptional LysR family regulator